MACGIARVRATQASEHRGQGPNGADDRCCLIVTPTLGKKQSDHWHDLDDIANEEERKPGLYTSAYIHQGAYYTCKMRSSFSVYNRAVAILQPLNLQTLNALSTLRPQRRQSASFDVFCRYFHRSSHRLLAYLQLTTSDCGKHSSAS